MLLSILLWPHLFNLRGELIPCCRVKGFSLLPDGFGSMVLSELFVTSNRVSTNLKGLVNLRDGVMKSTLIIG